MLNPGLEEALSPLIEAILKVKKMLQKLKTDEGVEAEKVSRNSTILSSDKDQALKRNNSKEIGCQPGIKYCSLKGISKEEKEKKKKILILNW